ncbi:MAG: DUF4198 domain-containing protein [Burkholderiaceae bacterium]
MKLITTPILSRLAPLALAAALLPLTAQAHMTWILPNTSTLSGKEPVVAVDAAVSEDLFNFERGLKLETVRITAPDGKPAEAENRVSSRHRDSFEVKLTQDGTYRISNVSQALMGSYKQGGETKRFRSTPATFAKDVPADAEVTAISLTTNRQQTFVSKEEPGKLAFAPEGDGLELLPLGPVTDLSHGDKTKLRLLLNGKPAADAQIKILRDGNRYRYKLGEVSLKTDAQGEFTVDWADAGRYWIGASAGPARGPDAPVGTREAPVQRASVSATFEVLPK